MANSVMMYDVLGYPPDHPHRAIARASLDKLLVVKDDEAYCQPCVSPVWDTALVAHALLEVGGETAVARGRARRSTGCKPLQVLDVEGRLGRCSGPMCGRAAGRSSTPTRTIPISTTPPSS